MNRRSFLSVLGLISAASPVLATTLVDTAPPRDPFEVLSPEEISRHFIHVDKPVFSTADSYGVRTVHVVKSYYTKGMVFGDVWFLPDGSVNESERRRQAKIVIPYIKERFRLYQNAWRGHAEVFGPYVHNVRLGHSPLRDHNNRVIHHVMMRVAYVRIPL